VPFFVPPEPPVPHIYHLASPQYGARRLTVSSHGYVYSVSGNTLIPEQAIATIIKKSKDPKEAIDSISSYYKKKGYFLVAVKASVESKRINVQIIEGAITQKKIAPGLAWFFNGLEDKNNLVDNDIVYASVLANAYAQRNGKQIQIGFAPSSNPGGSELLVESAPLSRYSPLSGNVFFGNYGSRYASRYLAGGSLSYNIGYGLNISANVTQGLPSLAEASKGSAYTEGGLGASAITPWGIYGFNAGWTHYRIGRVTYPYFPTGNVFTWSLTGSQLLYATPSTRISVNESYNHVSNHVRVGQQLIPGGILLTDQVYNYFAIGAQANHAVTVFGHPGSISSGITYNQGVNGSHGTLYNDIPEQPAAQFHYFDANVAWTQTLVQGMNLSINASGQGAFNTLPSQQQWVLGGFGNLSAYYPAVLVGDSGYTGRIQLQSPGWNVKGWRITGSVFAEYGAATSTYLPPRTPAWQYLSDVGVGLNVVAPWGTSISALSALPTGHGHVSEAVRNQDRVDVYFVLSQTF
jgi:hemolysin activation/secretion protein